MSNETRAEQPAIAQADPAFEDLGTFEEYITVDDPVRTLGTRRVEREPGREFGANGRRQVEITEPINLQRGHKFKLFKASPSHPIRVWTMIFPICGKKLTNK